MKIEMGESLLYSWLRHVKKCQVVQTNWKPSPSWTLRDEDKLELFMNITDKHFEKECGYNVYKIKRNSAYKIKLKQLLRQAEVDLVGICINNDGTEVHTIDVAFHEGGLGYGGTEENVTRVIKKVVRTALCMVGYFGITKGKIIFASPKIHNATIQDLAPCIDDLNAIFLENGYSFTAQVIANDDFNTRVLQEVLCVSVKVSDTSELFIRGYQLIKMFDDERSTRQRVTKPIDDKIVSKDVLSELKVGKIAQTFLREALESGKADDEEVSLMLTKDYSKNTFGIDFPLLVSADKEHDATKYYAKPLTIRNRQYLLCSHWYETLANNDKKLLLVWLDKHANIDMDSPQKKL
jgi:hypothetical protein